MLIEFSFVLREELSLTVARVQVAARRADWKMPVICWYIIGLRHYVVFVKIFFYQVLLLFSVGSGAFGIF